MFPNPENAPGDAPLAAGGNLEPEMLLAAYSLGIFPWYSGNAPILWWSPDPRALMPLSAFHLPRRSARKLAHTPFEITLNRAFAKVIENCGSPRDKGGGTWITPEMLEAYVKLHELGYAHSVETWRAGKLVGGLYGLALGRAFFGESMFHTETEASRAALAALVALLRQLDFLLLDIQQETPHMMAMGAISVPRKIYLRLLAKVLGKPSRACEGAICPWPPRRKKFMLHQPAGACEAGQPHANCATGAAPAADNDLLHPRPPASRPLCQETGRVDLQKGS